MISKNSLVSICLTIGAIYCGYLLMRDDSPEDKAVNPLDKLEVAIYDLPDSQLKRNLFTVIAAEYTSDSKELSELLQAYSKMKIKEIQNKDSL